MRSGLEIQTGVSDGEWIEVTNLERPKASTTDHPGCRSTVLNR